MGQGSGWTEDSRAFRVSCDRIHNPSFFCMLSTPFMQVDWKATRFEGTP